MLPKKSTIIQALAALSPEEQKVQLEKMRVEVENARKMMTEAIGIRKSLVDSQKALVSVLFGQWQQADKELAAEHAKGATSANTFAKWTIAEKFLVAYTGALTELKTISINYYTSLDALGVMEDMAASLKGANSASDLMYGPGFSFSPDVNDLLASFGPKKEPGNN